MLRGPFLVQMEAIGQEPKCASVVSWSPSPLRLPQFLAISTAHRRRAAETPEARAEAVKLSAREKEMFARSGDHHAILLDSPLQLASA